MKKKHKERRMPCMGTINIKFNKMIIPRVRRRGKVGSKASICSVLVLKIL